MNQSFAFGFLVGYVVKMLVEVKFLRDRLR